MTNTSQVDYCLAGIQSETTVKQSTKIQEAEERACIQVGPWPCCSGQHLAVHCQRFSKLALDASRGIHSQTLACVLLMLPEPPDLDLQKNSPTTPYFGCFTLHRGPLAAITKTTSHPAGPPPPGLHTHPVPCCSQAQTSCTGQVDGAQADRRKVEVSFLVKKPEMKPAWTSTQ